MSNGQKIQFVQPITESFDLLLYKKFGFKPFLLCCDYKKIYS